jgi:Holliday junction resolvasome RuvABC ATP-dependent DNA helicase subunit
LNQVALDPYELRELKAIAEKAGKERGLTLTPQAARHLAERSHRTPRSVEGLVELLRRTKSGLATVDQHTVRTFLEELGIDERGLNRSQHEYLRTLAAAAGQYTSLAVLGTRLGLDAKYIREDIESHLMLLNLVEIGSGGRALTEKGRAVANALAAGSEAADDSDLSDSAPKEATS